MKVIGYKGFTLVELMVTLSVLAVLVSAGVPTFSAMVKNNRLAAEDNALRGVLSAARSEARTQRTTVTVCRSANRSTCSAGDWSAGYIAFTDLDNDRQLDEADGEKLLQTRVEDAWNVVVRYSQASDILFFDSSGNAFASNGTFTFCDDRGAAEARGLIVTAIGAMRTAVAPDADGSSQIVQDHAGNGVSCS